MQSILAEAGYTRNAIVSVPNRDLHVVLAGDRATLYVTCIGGHDTLPAQCLITLVSLWRLCFKVARWDPVSLQLRLCLKQPTPAS